MDTGWMHSIGQRSDPRVGSRWRNPNEGIFHADDFAEYARYVDALADGYKHPHITATVPMASDAHYLEVGAAAAVADDPPSWAYPTAWKVAILASLERVDGSPVHFGPKLLERGGWWHDCLKHHHGRSTMSKSTLSGSIEERVIRAYWRATEKPKPVVRERVRR